MENKELAVIPIPEEIREPGKSYWHSDILPKNTPYNDMSWQETVRTYAIKLPFSHIVTKDEGTSVCPHCNAKYVGQQNVCTNKVWWYRVDYRFQRGDFVIGDRASYSYDRVKETKMDDCGSYTAWDLQEKFNEQQALFSFLNWLGSVPTHPTWIHKYSNIFPIPEVTGMIEMRALRNDVDRMLTEISQHREAIRQIAEKMNQAGNALSFGF